MFTFVSGNTGLDFAGTLQHRRSDRRDLLAGPEDLARWVVEAGILDAPPTITPDHFAQARALREAIYRLAADASPTVERAPDPSTPRPGSEAPDLLATPSGHEALDPSSRAGRPGTHAPSAPTGGQAVRASSAPASRQSARPSSALTSGEAARPSSAPAGRQSALPAATLPSRSEERDSPPSSSEPDALDADRAMLNDFADRLPAGMSLNAQGQIVRTGDLDAALSTVARTAVELLGGPLAVRVRECGDETCTRLYVDVSRGASRRWCGMQECGNRAKAAAFRARHRPPP